MAPASVCWTPQRWKAQLSKTSRMEVQLEGVRIAEGLAHASHSASEFKNTEPSDGAPTKTGMPLAPAQRQEVPRGRSLALLLRGKATSRAGYRNSGPLILRWNSSWQQDRAQQLVLLEQARPR